MVEQPKFWHVIKTTLTKIMIYFQPWMESHRHELAELIEENCIELLVLNPGLLHHCLAIRLNTELI